MRRGLEIEKCILFARLNLIKMFFRNVDGQFHSEEYALIGLSLIAAIYFGMDLMLRLVSRVKDYYNNSTAVGYGLSSGQISIKVD